MNAKKNGSLFGRHVSEVKFDEFNLETEQFSLEHLHDSEENVALIEQFSSASLLEAEAERPKRPSRSFGMAKGDLRYPDDIDFCNDEIARMFGVNA